MKGKQVFLRGSIHEHIAISIEVKENCNKKNISVEVFRRSPPIRKRKRGSYILKVEENIANSWSPAWALEKGISNARKSNWNDRNCGTGTGKFREVLEILQRRPFHREEEWGNQLSKLLSVGKTRSTSRTRRGSPLQHALPSSDERLNCWADRWRGPQCCVASRGHGAPSQSKCHLIWQR